MARQMRRLLKPERERRILERLESGCKAVADLCAEIGMSEATVRRDLDSLETSGRITRVHGGAAKRRSPAAEPVFQEKDSQRSSEKLSIAEAALAMIEDGDVIYLDGGSTVLRLARLLGVKHRLTIVTNSLTAAWELLESSHKLILVGGEFRAISRTMVGPLTAPVVERLRFDKAFMGTLGLTLEDGISTTDTGEAFTKSLVMGRSKAVVVLADSSKLGESSFAASGPLEEIDTLVTDAGAPPEFVQSLERRGVRVVVTPVKINR